MALKLLTLLAVFATCGIVHAEKNEYCSTICSEYQGPTARNVVRGQKHRASRSKGHLTRANQRASSLADFCSSRCQDGGISTRQSGMDFTAIPQFPQQVMGAFGSGLSDFTNPAELLTGGSASSGSGSESSGSRAGSSVGEPGISEIFSMPGQIISSIMGQSSGLPFPFSNGGSSGGQSSGSESGSSSGGSGIQDFFEIPGQLYNSVFGGRGTESSTSGGQSGQNLVSYCQQVCNNAAPRVSRIPSSARQGASHGLKERHGVRSSLPLPAAGQHSRQGPSSSGACPSFCNDVIPDLLGSGSSSQSSSTGESGTSASGSDGSSTTSGSASGSSGGSTGGSSSGK